MPLREEIFLNGGFYHVFNKTIDKRKLFSNTIYCRDFLTIARYYRTSKKLPSFSKFRRLPKSEQYEIHKVLFYKKFFHVDILAYCLMPTHFHLLLHQKKDDGVRTFMTNLMNSFTRYFNIKNERKGPLFLPRFKAVQITSDEQLIHVSRYIHLNPYSSRITDTISEMLTYKYSSMGEYLKSESKGNLCNASFILEMFNGDRNRYQEFVVGSADYQRKLEHLKHIKKWGITV